MNPELREAVYKSASLYFDGLIAYTTLTQMTANIAQMLDKDHRFVQQLVDDLCESWDVE